VDRSVVLRAAGLQKAVRLPNGDRLTLLDGVDLELAAGTTTAVTGRSGSGKSTLLACLGLLSRYDSGSLTIDGTDMRTVSDRRRSRLRNQHIGFVFQSYSLVAHLTAAENVALPLMHGGRVSARERRRRVGEALASVDLSQRAQSKPRHLSGGEQQRVALARALVRRPAVLLADEPTGALDTATADVVWTAITRAASQSGVALLVVTHDTDVAARADRVLRLEDARLREAE
jgi:ABC-type lipoprotein export system ATPase subunit